MSDYPVSVTATVNTWPGNNGTIADYSIAADLSSLPAGFMTVDSTGHFKATMQRTNGKISGPVSPGEKITFTFAGSAGFTVTDVTGLNGLVGGLAWGAASTNNGTTSITATVTNAPVDAGTLHTEYDIKMATIIQTASIDPDFETDVA